MTCISWQMRVMSQWSSAGRDLTPSKVRLASSSGLRSRILVLTGVVALNGAGNELANSITGNAGNNALSGNLGNDTLIGGVGTDTMLGGVGDDTYFVDSSAEMVTELV